MVLNKEEFLLLSDNMKCTYIYYIYSKYFNELNVGEQSNCLYGIFIEDCLKDYFMKLGIKVDNFFDLMEYSVFTRISEPIEFDYLGYELEEHLSIIRKIKDEIFYRVMEDVKNNNIYFDVKGEVPLENEIACRIYDNSYCDFDLLTEEEKETLISEEIKYFDKTEDIDSLNIKNKEMYRLYLNQKIKSI